MTGFTIEQAAEREYRISGDLVFATAKEILAAGEKLLENTSVVTFDLEGVSHTDSAGLAVLLEWMAIGRGSGADIRYRNLPESMLEIARMSNALSLLGRDAD